MTDEVDRRLTWRAEADPAATAPLATGVVQDAPTGGSPASAPPGGQSRRPRSRGWRLAVEWGILVVAAIAIALLIKTFLFQAFYIPSESMVPTLEVGDRVLVNKLSYDLHDVHRGDIVVFEAGPNPQWKKSGINDLVKRVIGLPGEQVSLCPAPDVARVCINGKELKEPYLPKGAVTNNLTTQIVPTGEYFVMGDNRNSSADSRLHGPIKGSSIIGRVFLRIWPLDRLGFL